MTLFHSQTRRHMINTIIGPAHEIVVRISACNNRVRLNWHMYSPSEAFAARTHDLGS